MWSKSNEYVCLLLTHEKVDGDEEILRVLHWLRRLAQGGEGQHGPVEAEEG